MPVASLWRRHTKLYGVRCSKSSAGWSYLCWKVSQTSYSNTFHWMKGWVLIIFHNIAQLHFAWHGLCCWCPKLWPTNNWQLDFDLGLFSGNSHTDKHLLFWLKVHVVKKNSPNSGGNLFLAHSWTNNMIFVINNWIFSWISNIYKIGDCRWWCRLDWNLLLCIKQATTANGSNELQVRVRQV